MTELLQENAILLVIAVVIALVILWWVIAANRKTRVEIARQDEADAVARRNQALIDAPPAAAREPASSPVPSPSPGDPPAPAAGADDLLQIKGLGPKIMVQLADMGITTFAEIAAWDDAEIDRVDAQMGRFQGRIRRDQWVEQARLLATGDATGYAARFGNK